MKKYKILAVLICSIGLMFLLTGVTYSFFNYTKTGASNDLIAGDIYMHLNEGEDQISLNNVFPETIEEARARNDNEITFTINGLNTSNKRIYYEIDLIHGDELSGYTRFSDSDLKFDLIEVGDNNEETYLVDAGNYDDLTNKRIWVDTVDANTTTEIERTYKLRMWLSENILISDTIPFANYPATGANAFKNHFASIKVKVVGDFEKKEMPWAYYMFANNVDTETTINFANASSSTNGEGIYVLPGTEDDKYPIYYYRGAVNNNNVIFGNYCWQIVRTTDTGGIKMIYNGGVTSVLDEFNAISYNCDNRDIANRIIATDTYNYNSITNNRGLYQMGYMSNAVYQDDAANWTTNALFASSATWVNDHYELIDASATSPNETHHYSCNSTNANDTCTNLRYVYSSYSKRYIVLTDGDLVEDAIYKMTGNGSAATKQKNSGYVLNQEDSDIKTTIEDWFRTNLTNEVNSSNMNYLPYLEDTIFCNDRSFKTSGVGSLSASGWNPAGGDLNNTLSFGTMNRAYNNWYSTTNVPSLTCPNETDSFSVGNSIAHLNYPVGLLTADEMVMAGVSGDSGTSNNTFYLYTGNDTWTMSPNNYNTQDPVMFTLFQTGSFGFSSVDGNQGIRPVVSLKLGVEFKEGGDGTPTNPYIVKYN